MQDKVSVYNSPGGAAPQAPPPPRPSPMLFKRDGFLNDSFIPPGTKLEDAIRFESIQKKQGDVLDKYFKMLLSSLLPKWMSEPNTPRPPREPIQRKERVQKEKTPSFEIGKKIEDKSDQLLIALGKVLQPAFKPPYKLALNGLDLLGKGLIKTEELIDKVFLKAIVEPIIFLHEKMLPPLQKTLSYLVEKIELSLDRLVREVERAFEFVIAPLSEALETVQTILTKLYVPFKKGKNWLSKKLPSIPKPNFEPFDRIFVKPFKVFINTFIATPLAKAIQKVAQPIKQGSQYLAKKGGMAYLIVSNFCRAVGASIGKWIEKHLRRFAHFLVWLYQLLKSFVIYLWNILKKLGQLIESWIYKAYLAACHLTQWAASRFSR